MRCALVTGVQTCALPILTLASLHVISMQLALALVLGANVGGAFAPIVMTLGQPSSARRIPLGNLLMRAAGAGACVWTIPYRSEERRVGQECASTCKSRL